MGYLPASQAELEVKHTHLRVPVHTQIFTLHDSASDVIFAVHIDHLARRDVIGADGIFKDCATKQMYCTCELQTMDLHHFASTRLFKVTEDKRKRTKGPNTTPAEN